MDIGFGAHGNWTASGGFVDALVRSRQCIRECATAAAAFADYLTGPSTLEWMLLSDDAANNRVPRYLIPAHRDPYTARVREDPYYHQINAQLVSSRPYPSFGLYYIRGDLRNRLREELLK